jgi:hypothetical protein
MAQINIKKNDSTSISTPPVGIQALFVANDGGLYTMNSFGTVSTIGGGGSGSSGTSGLSGTSGSSGSSGVSGGSGSSGTSGSNGSSGTSGANGGTGSSGTSGVSGTSGTSPGGGGAGLVSGVGLYSVQSNTTLTPGATAIGDNSIAIGSTVSAYYQSVYIGTNITDVGTSSVYIGNNINQAYGAENNLNNVLIGSDLMNRTSGPGTEYVGGSVIIGNEAKVDTFYYGHENVVIGPRAKAEAFNNSSVSIGAESRTGRFWSVAIGFQPNAGDASCVAIGAQTAATGDSSTAIGRSTNASGSLAVAYGYQANASANNTTAVGPSSNASAVNSVALGYQTAASHANSVVLGVTMSSVVTDHTHVRSLFIDVCPVYADNTAALAGGLVAGQVYRTSTGVLMITY